jgi:7 transmembrane receptor (rhodopsin family)
MSSDIVTYFAENHTIILPHYGMVAYCLNMIACLIGTVASFTLLVPLIYYRIFDPHSMLIISLCIADFFLTLTSLVVIVTHIFTLSWATPLFSATTGCMIDAVTVTIFAHISALSFFAISIERDLAICKRWYAHDYWIIGLLAVQWIYAGIIGGFIGSSPGNVEMDFSLIACQPNSSSREPIMLYVNYSILVFYIVGTGGCMYCYGAIFSFYKARQNRLDDQNVQPEAPVKRTLKVMLRVYQSLSLNEKKLLVKIVIITSVFLIFNIPFLASLLYKTITGKLLSFWASAFVNQTLMINSALNPFLLYKLDASIYQQFNLFYGFKGRPFMVKQPVDNSHHLPPTVIIQRELATQIMLRVIT